MRLHIETVKNNLLGLERDDRVKPGARPGPGAKPGLAPGLNQPSRRNEGSRPLPVEGTIRGLLAGGDPDGIAITAPERSPLSRRALAAQMDSTIASLRALGIGRAGSRRHGAAQRAGDGGAVSRRCRRRRRGPPQRRLSRGGVRLLSVGYRGEAAADRGRAGIARPAPWRHAAASPSSMWRRSSRRRPAAIACSAPESRCSRASSAPASSAAPQEVALVLHTSGTTSRPKIVPLTHSNLTASARNIGRTLGLEPCRPLPRHHAAVPYPWAGGRAARLHRRRRQPLLPAGVQCAEVLRLAR